MPICTAGKSRSRNFPSKDVRGMGFCAADWRDTTSDRERAARKAILTEALDPTTPAGLAMTGLLGVILHGKSLLIVSGHTRVKALPKHLRLSAYRPECHPTSAFGRPVSQALRVVRSAWQLRIICGQAASIILRVAWDSAKRLAILPTASTERLLL